MSSETSYYQARAAQEQRAADEASAYAARERHLELAVAYLARANDLWAEENPPIHPAIVRHATG